jgi:hypothetical protein
MAGRLRLGSKWRIAAVAAAACAAGSAGAAMPGLYFAGFYMDSTLAYSSVDATVGGFDASTQGAWEDLDGTVQSWQSEISDDTDIGYGFSVGYQFSQYLAAELGYVDMGTVHYAANGVVSDGTSSYDTDTFASAKSKGLLVAGVAILPLGDQFSLDARAGMLVGKTRVRASLYLTGQLFAIASEKDNRNSPVFGAGVNWAISPGTAIRAGWSRMQKAMVSEYDVSSWTLSLKYAW